MSEINLADKTRSLRVELPARNEILHAYSVVSCALAEALVHVELMSLHKLITVDLNTETRLIRNSYAAVHDLKRLFGKSLNAFLPDPVRIQSV